MDILDVLRGIAILLIFFQNVNPMGNTAFGYINDPRLLGWNTADRTCWYILSIFIHGTARGLLEFLFGASALILLKETMRPDGPVQVADLFFRRNLWLALFGFVDIAAMVWFGDILLMYALCALFLFPFRRLSALTLTSVTAVYLLVVAVHGYTTYHHRAAGFRDAELVRVRQAAGQPLTSADRAALSVRAKQIEASHLPPALLEKEQLGRTGSFVKNSAWSFHVWSSFVFPETILEIFPTMLLGMALFKWKVIQGERSARFYASLALLCYIPGLLIRATEALQNAKFDALPNIGEVAGPFARIAVALGHLALINLLYRTVICRRLLAPFRAAGRTAFTLYLTQNMLGMLVLFPTFGMGLYARYGWSRLSIFALATVICQLLLANLWLRYFTLGPLEWLWRSLSYEKRQPLRIGAARADSVAV